MITITADAGEATITDGKWVFTCCPCCRRPMTHTMAERLVDGIERGSWTMDDLAAMSKLTEPGGIR